jgi:hypothetical protein
MIGTPLEVSPGKSRSKRTEASFHPNQPNVPGQAVRGSGPAYASQKFGDSPMKRPISANDLLSIERIFAAAMTDLGFGRFEYLRIDHGELLLDPWPCAVRQMKFAFHDPGIAAALRTDFELASQVAELFEYIRDVDAGEIRILEVEHGLPFSLEIELAGRRGHA